MRLRRKVWIAIIVVCIGLSVYEIPKAIFIWRYARTFSHTEEIFKEDKKAKSEQIQEILGSDPEAADILRYCITDPNDEELAVLVARYPENEFLLAQLADNLIEANLVDSRAVLSLTDRLIELSPKNAHYRYLKGWAILNRPGVSGREQDALEQFELGNELSSFYLPYSRYKERVDILGEKLYISPIQWKAAEIKDRRVYSRCWNLVPSWKDSIVPMDKELLRRLSAAISRIGARLVDEAHDDFLVESGMFILMLTDSFRLQEFNLGENESEQARFRISQAVEIIKIVRNSDIDWGSAVIPMVTFGSLATAVLCIFLPLLIVWLFIIAINRIRGQAQQVSVEIKAYILFFISLCSMFGLLSLITVLKKRLPGGFLGGVLFAGAAIIVWTLLWLLAHIRPVDYSRFRRSRKWSGVICGLLWVIVTIIVIVDSNWNSYLSKGLDWLEFLGIFLIWFVFCAIIWFIASYRQNMFRAIPYGWLLRNRFVQLILVLLFMTGITFLLLPVPLGPFFSVCLTILFAGLIATHVSNNRFIYLDGIRHFFGKEGEIVIIRTKMARLTGTSLIICWVTVLAANHIFAANFSKLNTIWASPLSRYDGPLPQATQETYERVVLGKDTGELSLNQPNEKLSEPYNTRYLYLASPEDISAIITERKSAGNPFTDNEIISLLKQCGYDVRSILLNEITDPNSIDIFQKIEWGDKTVKEELEQTFEDEMATFSEAPTEEDASEKSPSRLEKLLELAGALTYFSEPEEAKGRLSRLLMPVVKITNEKPEKPGFFEGFISQTPELRLQARQRDYAYERWKGKVEQFFASLGKLPKTQATELFKSYLSQTQIINLIDEQDLDILIELIEKLADRELAEKILEIVIKSAPIEESYDIPVGQAIKVSEAIFPKHTKDASYKFLEAIYPHLSEESVPLLLEHLDSGNEQLRAFIVWRLTSLGYEWTSEQFGTLSKDDHWKVRLNALFACDTDDLETALDDKSGTVRVVAQILSQVR